MNEMNDIPHTDKMIDPNWKTMLGLAFIADAESGKPLESQETAETRSYETIGKALTDERISRVIGHWNIRRKPWILLPGADSAKKTGWARNTTVVFSRQQTGQDGKESIPRQIVIGVAGTNFISSYDWFVEDLETETLVPWNTGIVVNGPNNSGSATGGYVSKGTAQALYNTWQMKDSKDGITLCTYLRNYLSSDEFSKIDRISLTVTGHSLGGALSPALAQALFENRTDWCPSHITPEINSFIFAGPTPGDADFRNHVQNGNVGVSSLYNIYDVVPHAWTLCSFAHLANTPCLENLHAIYESVIGADGTEPGKIVKTIVDWAIAKSKTAKSDGHQYVRWEDEVRIKGVLPLEKDIEKTAWAMTELLIVDLHKHKNRQHLENIKKVCGLSTASDGGSKEHLKVFLEYFWKFLIILGNEHIQQYTDVVVDDKDFKKAIHNYFGRESWIDRLKESQGIDIIFKLFDEISARA